MALADLLNDNFFTECLGLLLGSIAGGVAVRLKVSEWKIGVAASLAVLAVYVAKVTIGGASLWAAFVAVRSVLVLMVAIVVNAYVCRRILRKEYERALAEDRRILAEKHQEQERAMAEDRAWSTNPFQFLKVVPCKCGINFSERALSLRLSVDNRFSKARRLWVSANVAVYRDGGTKPLFTIPLPVTSVDAAANGTTEASPMWPATMEPAHAAEAKAVYERDRILKVQLVNATVTTLVDLSGDPRAVSNALPLVTPIAAEDVFCE